ncbi:3-hydroxyacyl-CoA dehydrogenase NAD-binding domain-containing protein [Pseudahrensia aquimaris]|uniref:3-hydroxyacyl-CoA dehydrogenase NAD-binding domain-containing protein n=1 Tax=Pseudahrensia aquimaris TaxID=744461 RepID=A0ABW3FIB9_9HYPH
MTDSVSIEWRDKIAVIWIDNPPVNALSHHVRVGIVERVKEAVDAGAEAAVLAGRGGTFIAGADIREFGKPPMEPMLPEVCDILEATDMPLVAAIEGNTLGGGLETALGCHFQVADAKAKIGLPEVLLGLLPGAGGTQRAPRAIDDPAEALAMITSGKPVSGTKAFEIGLVDAVSQGNTVDDAVEFAKGVVGQDMTDRRLCNQTREMTPEIVAVFDEAMPKIIKQAKGAIAPVKAAECVKAAFELPFREGLAKERETFIELVQSDQSAALRHIFFAERAAAKAPKDVKGEPRTIKKVGVIGAGTMGGGISMTYIEAGFPVTLLEMSDEALDRGLTTIRKNWERGIRSGRVTAEQVEERMALYTRTTDFADLADCDLIIEAVFETMDIKKEVFGKLDKIAKPGAILATNTSYLDVDAIAAQTSRPQDVLGMHYFSPANIMKLLEIVRAEKTADDVLLTALDMAKKTRKQPVVAGVGHGFIGNRMLTPYIRQANLLVLEGATPEQVDKALTDFGWAMGVFAVSDLAGLDIGYKSRADQDLSDDERRVYTIADRLVEAGHLGQKSGSGFYSYDPETRARTPNPEALRIMEEVRREMGINTRTITDEEIIERTQFALANEGAHVLGEGVAQSAGDIDVVYNYGYGYPRWRGGPMKYAETVGLDKVAAKLTEWADGAGGVHWNPSDLLMEAAEQGDGFDGVKA